MNESVECVAFVLVYLKNVFSVVIGRINDCN